MHVIIAFLTAVAGLLYALERLGVDIGWLNPWAWRRRRRWMKQLHTNPAFNIDQPMEAAALLLLATARIDGDLSMEEKNALKALFVSEFRQSDRDASSLLSSSTYLLGAGDDVFSRPQEVLQRSLDKFSQDQKTSTINLMTQVAELGGAPSQRQRELIDAVQTVFAAPDVRPGW